MVQASCLNVGGVEPYLVLLLKKSIQLNIINKFSKQIIIDNILLKWFQFEK